MSWGPIRAFWKEKLELYEVLAAESAAAAALLPLLELNFIVTTLIPLFYEIQFKLKIIELNLNNSYLDIS